MLGGEFTPSQPTSRPPAGPLTMRVCAAARRWRRGIGERAVSRGLRLAVPVLKPEVAAVIRKWTPRRKVVPYEPPRLRRVVVPLTRRCVTATAPQTTEDARRLLRYTAAMLVWADKSVGTVAPDIITPNNVGVFLRDARTPDGEPPSLAWKRAARTAMWVVGPAVGPDAGWDGERPPVPFPPFSEPYDAADEDVIQLACGLPGAHDPAALLWSVAGTMSTGMTGVEALVAEVGDVHEWGNGRLVVQVRGLQPRLVPVRVRWTDTVRESVQAVRSRPYPSFGRFIACEGYGSAAVVARRLPCGMAGGVSLSRARATWLAAHLLAGTPLPALRMLAGSLDWDALQCLHAALDLPRFTRRQFIGEHPLTPEQAVQLGMGA